MHHSYMMLLTAQLLVGVFCAHMKMETQLQASVMLMIVVSPMHNPWESYFLQYL